MIRTFFFYLFAALVTVTSLIVIAVVSAIAIVWLAVAELSEGLLAFSLTARRSRERRGSACRSDR
jgi:hypothetical protein